jgi:hypothetical protein
MQMNRSAANLHHAVVIAVLTRMIFVWVVIDPFQKFFVGAKQPKRKKEQSWPGAGSDQTAPGIKREDRLDPFLSRLKSL